MRFLCVCHVVTAHLAPLLQYVAARHELILAIDRYKKGVEIPGAKYARFKRPDGAGAAQDCPGFWRYAAQCGKCAVKSFEAIAQSGFTPDVIMLASTGGATLGLKDVFPQSFVAAYFDAATPANPAEARFRAQMRAIQQLESDMVFDFGANPANGDACAAPLAVDASFFAPPEKRRPAPGKGAPVFCLKGLTGEEFERWAKIARDWAAKSGERAIILAPHLEAVRVLENFFAQSASTRDRLACACNLPDKDAKRLFQAASLLVWPGNRILPELLQAMSCETPLAAPEIPGLLGPGLNCSPLPHDAASLLEGANDESLADRARNAREIILEKFDAEKVGAAHLARLCEGLKKKRGAAPVI